jgi:hypothetical protein
VDEIECPRQIGHEDETRLQGSDEQGLPLRVLGFDLPRELADAFGDLPRGEVEVADQRVGG